MSTITEVMNIIFLVVILAAIAFFLYEKIIKDKMSQKIEKEIKTTIKRNLKNTDTGVIPDDWLKNPNPSDLDKFLDSSTETNLSGGDLAKFLKGLSGGNTSMFSSIFNNMLTNDSALLTTLATKLGISPMIAKPILITALSGVSVFGNKILTNVLTSKLTKSVQGVQQDNSTPRTKLFGRGKARINNKQQKEQQNNEFQFNDLDF